MYQIKIIDKDTGEVKLEQDAKAIVYGYSTDKAAFSGSCTKATAQEVAGAINAAREAGDKLMSDHPRVAGFAGMMHAMKTAERASAEAAAATARECDPLRDLLQRFIFGGETDK